LAQPAQAFNNPLQPVAKPKRGFSFGITWQASRECLNALSRALRDCCADAREQLGGRNPEKLFAREGHPQRRFAPALLIARKLKSVLQANEL
jgi:hypothetical protein